MDNKLNFKMISITKLKYCFRFVIKKIKNNMM